MRQSNYTTLFLDVGGVILTNGWDRTMRAAAAQKFGLDLAEMDKRHGLTFDTYEIGKISLDTYLDRVVFYIPRSFTQDVFKEFMFEQSQPLPEMIPFIQSLKKRYSLRIVAVSNEGRELMIHRIERFHLKEFIDSFACSCFTGYKKPDMAIYRLALDIAQVDPKEVIYLDDRLLLTEVGASLGMKAIRHESYEQTKKMIETLF